MEKDKILIMNGVNLNLLGIREPHIYGNQTFEDYFEELQNLFPQFQLEYFQSNVEGFLVDKLHEVGFSYRGILLNAGAYTHTSIALADAIAGITTPVIEVHISNIYKRETFRHKSFLTAYCQGIVSGFGLKSYAMALNYFL